MQRPEIKPITDLHIFQPQCIKLDNGIPLYVFNLGDQEASRLDIIYEGGRCDGNNQTESELVSATLREGTLKHNAAEIAETLDFYGSWFGGDASSHSITLSLYILNRNFSNVVPLLAEIATEPSFPEHEFQTLKSAAKTRLTTNREKVAFLSMETFAQMHFGDKNNLGKKVTEQVIDGITTESLRQFHKDWFHPANMKILLSGKVDDEMIGIINKTFGSISDNTPHRESHNDLPTVDFNAVTQIVNKTGAVQSCIRMGIPAVLRTDPEYIPLRILTTALGGYFGSRLMTNIREDKGYTYGISASLLGYRDTSMMMITSQCDTSYTWKVIDEIKKEIEQLQTEPILPDELNRIKSHMLSDLARTLDTPFSIADYYASMFTNHFPEDYFTRQVEIINSITPAELLDIAQRHISADRFLTVVAGDEASLKSGIA